MVKILKKADILRNIDEPEQRMIESIGSALWLRPLSNKELDEIDEIEAKAMGTFETNERGKRGSSESSSKGKLNVARITSASAEAKVEMVYRSLDNPKNEDDPWTYEDINKLKRYMVDEIVKNVKELSGEEIKKSDVERFPKNR